MGQHLWVRDLDRVGHEARHARIRPTRRSLCLRCCRLDDGCVRLLSSSGRVGASPAAAAIQRVPHRAAPSSGRPTSPERLGHALQPGTNLPTQGLDLGPGDHAQHRLRIHEHDMDRAIGILAHDHVAGKQCPDIRVGLQGLVGEMGVAGPENHVRALLHAELGLERGLHVDRGQHAEALLLERLGDGLHGGLEALRALRTENIRTHDSLLV